MGFRKVKFSRFQLLKSQTLQTKLICFVLERRIIKWF